MDGRLFLVELIGKDELDDDRAFIVVPKGEHVSLHVELAVKALVEGPTVVTPDGRVLNVEGEVVGVVSFKEVCVPGWTIVARRDPWEGPQWPRCGRLDPGSIRCHQCKDSECPWCGDRRTELCEGCRGTPWRVTAELCGRPLNGQHHEPGGCSVSMFATELTQVRVQILKSRKIARSAATHVRPRPAFLMGTCTTRN